MGGRLLNVLICFPSFKAQVVVEKMFVEGKFVLLLPHGRCFALEYALAGCWSELGIH